MDKKPHEYNVLDGVTPESQKAEKKQFNENQKRARKLVSVYHDVFTGPMGIEVLKDLKERCFDSEALWDGTEDLSDNQLAYRAGRQWAVRFIEGVVKQHSGGNEQ